MAKLTANFKDISVSELRRNLARIVSKIDGGLKVTHASFTITVEMPKRQFPKGD